jgi:beta-phosphoglucomutase family hydrolase
MTTGPAPGLPPAVRACLFDLDGVLTPTADVHAAAWKELFDSFLRGWSDRRDRTFVAFDEVADYQTFVDGKPRADGIRSFLASRGIGLPDGGPDDPSGTSTVQGLGRTKNEIFLRRIRAGGVEPYAGSVRYVEAVRAAGIRTAVVSSSANCGEVLAAAGIPGLFDARIDGVTARTDRLAGKPAPDTYLAAARALGVTPTEAAVFEDALSGVEAGRSGGFAFVVGVDRAGQADALRRHGADLVVTDLVDLLALPAGIGEGLPFDRTWCLVVAEDPGDGAAARAVESRYCLADGTVGTRGVLEERQDPDAPVVMAAGLYGPAEVVGEDMLPLPSWCTLPVAGDLPPGRRVLDLRDGVLTRVTGPRSGMLRSARFACAERPGTGVLVAEADPGVLTGDPGAEETSTVARPRISPLGGGARLVTDTRVADTGSPGGRVAVERIAVHVVSTRNTPRHTTALERLGRARDLGPGALLGEQRRSWARRWDHADIEVVGDPELTRAVRFSLFHLLSSAARRGEAAVGARGLTGSAYAGHVFWDADVFVLPVLAAVDARAARAVLEYRIRRLGAARDRAAADGRAGARFPWESAHDGTDVTPRWGIDRRGERVAILTGDLEEHVTADVAWSAWRLASWAGDWSFLTGPGYPLVVDTARYWASRVRWDDRGRAHIDRVIGPDEYHEDVDDNAFTNLMARWNLRRAAEVVERVGAAGADLDEVPEWRRTADALVDGYEPATGRYEQFAGYDRLLPMVVSEPGRPIPDPARLPGPEELPATQVSKQADVLMAHLLIPEETVPGSLAENLRYYLPRCAQGSSLSPSVHATLLARAGRTDEALALLQVAAVVDLEGPTDATAEGLHLANLGGVWQAVVHGFAGVAVGRPDDAVLIVDPRLPAAWEELRVSLVWHGTPVHLVCRHDSVQVAPAAAVTVRVHGTVARVGSAGAWVG